MYFVFQLKIAKILYFVFYISNTLLKVIECDRANDETSPFKPRGKLPLYNIATEGMLPSETISKSSQIEKDPADIFQGIMYQTLFGKEADGMNVYLHIFSGIHSQVQNLSPSTFRCVPTAALESQFPFRLCVLTIIGRNITDHDDELMPSSEKLPLLLNNTNTNNERNVDLFAHYPSGKLMRADLFQNKSAVHLPMAEFLHSGHCYLKRTRDYMQTAVDAFAIILEGNLQDVLRLPPSYVLRSARTIAMMRITREKLAATWTVVKGGNRTEDISYQTLEMYRPLFKYVNGREIARLNLSDDRILKFIGTHADLSRHQVGVVASKYITLNLRWREPKYLNLMNNLLCGVPMTFMRRVPENTYLQLTHQVFYHIRACDPLQRRFYLAMMTRTQAIGKSFSWSARDVSRLGLLLSEVEGSDLSAVNPEAMAGITSQVMLEIPAHTLKHITETQLRFIPQKPLNILARKLKNFQEQQQIFNSLATQHQINSILSTLCQQISSTLKHASTLV